MLGASISFLTPRAAALALLSLVPIASLVVGDRRLQRVRRLLGLESPGATGSRRRAALLAAICLLLTVAAMQPVVRSRTSLRARTDAQAFVVIDTSRSMKAAASPGGVTRLGRARRAAIAAAGALGDVPAGVATLTDRVLPDLCPTPNRAAFDSAVEALTAEDPPPRDINTVATTFGALGELATEGFFPESVRKRAVVLVTDGESRPFDAAGLASLLADHGIHLAVIAVGSGSDRVYRPDGTLEAAYRPDAQGARQSLDQLGGVTVPGLAQALGTGPSRVVGVEPRARTLAPLAALLALVPLVLLVGGRALPGLLRGVTFRI
jgi:hypothetical protein